MIDRLSPDELYRLTKKKNRPAQERVLDRMKIPHERDGLGELVVLREAVNRRFVPGTSTETAQFDGSAEPNYSYFR